MSTWYKVYISQPDRWLNGSAFVFCKRRLPIRIPPLLMHVGKCLTVMLAFKRLACVAPEVDLGECTLHLPPQKVNKAEPTLALKQRSDITRNPKQGYQWPQNRTCIFVRRKHKNILNSFLYILPYSARLSSTMLQRFRT